MESKQYAAEQPKGHWINQSEKFLKYLETNENENTMIPNLWDTANAVLRGKFIVIQAYLGKQEKISNKQSKLTFKGNRKRRTNNPKLVKDKPHKVQSRKKMKYKQKTRAKMHKSEMIL